MASPKVYKEIIGKFALVQTEEDLNEVCGDIDRAFQSEKITWQDNEQLYKLAQLFQDRLVNSHTYSLNMIINDEKVEIGRFDTKKQATMAYQYVTENNGYDKENWEICRNNLSRNTLEIDGKIIRF